MALRSHQRERVISLASGSWNDFIDYTEGRFRIADTLALSKRPQPNEAIAEFAKFAADINGALGGVIVPAFIDDRHPKAVSWLVRMRDKQGDELVMIQLDYRRLQGGDGDVDGVHQRQLHRVINNVCLHEIGHLLCHSSQMSYGIDGRAVDPPGPQEAEAWCFCYVMVCLAVEEIAMDYKSAPEDKKHVWEHMRDWQL